MTWWQRLLFRRRAERELDAELRDHLDRLTTEYSATGEPMPDARRQAVLDFGGLDQIKEMCRDVRPARSLEILGRDVWYGLRVLKRSPSFTFVAIACLSLGVGVNTAVFSVFNAVLLKPLPYRQPEELVVVFKTSPQRNIDRTTFGPAEFLDWHGRLSSFTGLAAYQPWAPTLTGVEQTERLVGIRGSGDLMPTLGVAASAGRVLLPDDATARARVVVVSQTLWRRVFHSDPALIGRPVRLDGQPYTVVGIMPATFQFPTRHAEIWTPLMFDASQADRGEIGTAMIARLGPGATLARARADLAASMGTLRQEHADTYAGWEANAIPLRDWHIGASHRRTLWLLIGAVAIVLLTACANVANLLLAWGSARREEFAIRLTLGSSRLRIISQLLTECALLGLGGLVLGLALSVWAREAFVNLLPSGSPFRLLPIVTDWRVITYAVGIALVSVLTAGLAPVRHALRFDPSSMQGSRVASTRLRGSLLVAQAAATVLLLAGAGLLGRSFLNVWNLDPGFSRASVLTARIGLPGGAPASRQIEFFDDLLGRLASAPGSLAAGAISNLPLGGQGSSNYISIEGRPELHSGGEHASAERLSVTPGVLQALRIQVLEGRTFTAADAASAPLVVLVNRTFAARFYPGESPVGKRIKRGTPQAPFPWMTIVGVVGDIKFSSLLDDVEPTIFLAHTQTPVAAMTLVLRTDAPVSAMTAQLRSAVRAIDPNLPVGAIRPFDDIVFDSLADRTFPMLWFACFATLAVMLSALGVHGVVSYALAQRRREFGIRLALGATPRRLLAQALRQSLLPTVAGCALGLGATVWLTRVLSSLAYGIDVRELLWLSAAAAVLPVVVALVSAYPSARRVVSLNPTSVLRLG